MTETTTMSPPDLHRPIIPPAPKVHARELPALQVLFQFSRNTISVQPEGAFEDLIRRRRIFGLKSVLLNDPVGVRHVLTAGLDTYTRLVAAERILAPVVGNGLFLAEGADWRRQRRMLAPVFTPASIKLLLPHFVAAGARMADGLARAPQANLSRNFQETALDAVLRALFSLSDSADGRRIADMGRAYLAGPGQPQVLDAFARTATSFGFAQVSRRRFRKAWTALVDSVIAARGAAEGAGSKADLLSLLRAAKDPETGEALSQEEIRDQCSTMLVAGYETTARLLFWATYLLTLDRAEQARIQAEVAAFAPERVATLDDLQHWPRLRLTLLEALRLYPPVAYLSRQPKRDDIVGGEPLAAGTHVWISPWIMHRHRRFWQSPTAFLPDRFAGVASPWTSIDAYIPFGAGPRICIGASFALAEAQIVLATLLSRFSVSLASPRPVLPVAQITMAPDHEPQFVIEPRR